jgi:hypothetical protein
MEIDGETLDRFSPEQAEIYHALLPIVSAWYLTRLSETIASMLWPTSSNTPT